MQNKRHIPVNTVNIPIEINYLVIVINAKISGIASHRRLRASDQ